MRFVDRAHTWLLHATRAMRHPKDNSMKQGERISDDNALESIKVTYRPKGGSEWLDILTKSENGPMPEIMNEENVDEDKSHPHGTKYKPEMYRYVVNKSFIMSNSRTIASQILLSQTGTRVKGKAGPPIWNILLQ